MKNAILVLGVSIWAQCCAEEVPKTGICIVEQYRKDCGPCIRLGRELDKIKDVKIIREEITGEAPILIFYKDGKAVKVVIGYIDEVSIRTKIEEVKRE